MLQRIRNRKGFTLVELMIVVAIIGILAAIAIPNFLQFRLKAKTSEAKSNLGAIRSTEVAYFAEWDVYVGNQPTTPVDRATVADPDKKKPWVFSTRFSVLGFAPEGDVFFSYVIDPGTAIPDYPSGTEGFTVRAIGDLDADGALSEFSVTNASTEIAKTGAPF
jgi:type IV pilus assembly protein PilA